MLKLISYRESQESISENTMLGMLKGVDAAAVTQNMRAETVTHQVFEVKYFCSCMKVSEIHQKFQSSVSQTEKQPPGREHIFAIFQNKLQQAEAFSSLCFLLTCKSPSAAVNHPPPEKEKEIVSESCSIGLTWTLSVRHSYDL